MHPRFDRSGGRVLAAVLSAFALAITGSMATAAPTLAAASTLFADLSMDNVDPPPEEVASGSGTVTIDPAAGSICWDIIVSTTSETPTIELREGATGVNGSVVFDLGMLTGEAQAADCLAGQSESTLDAIVASPASYYILVSTETTPTGVLRAQLQPFVPMATASIITRLCPKAIQTVAQFDASPEGTCPSATRPGDEPTVPSGYSILGWAGSWTFDYTVKTVGDDTATLVAALPQTWGTCESTTETCTFGALTYALDIELTSSRTVRASTLPAGHRVGLVRVSSFAGAPIASSFNATTRTASFDLTGVDGDVWVEFVYFVSDTTPPSIGAPTPKLASGTITPEGRIPLTVSWSASDSGSGLDRYAIQRRVDGGSWTTLSSSITQKSYGTTVTAGHDYAFRVRGTDRVGNVSTWATGPTRTMAAIQDTSTAITYSGTWIKRSTTSAFGGSVRRSSSSNARASIARTMRSVEVIARTAPGDGRVRVYIDGALRATVDLDGPLTWRKVIWRGSWPSSSKHTVLVRPYGDGVVSLDAFVTLR